MKMVGIVLVVVGVLGLVFQTFSFKTTDKVVDIGPIDITKEKTHTTQVPIIASVAILVVGAGLVFFGRGARA